ncbi:MAG TPA: acyltransferase family protein, partial [Actinoplanes sp.]|nr:acyltransferase family protein [Actinoplanes sp.]
PLLVALVVLVAGRSPRRVLSATLIAIFGASLAYSVWLTRADQPVAYFHSLTRAWEFTLGGLLALGTQAVALPRWQRIVVGWAGVLALPVGDLVTRAGSEYPGYQALWPALCAAAVIAAGATGSRWGADRLLGWRPLTYLGDLGYCLYLWHWPVLVLYLVARDRVTVGWRGGAVVVAVSLVLSVVTHHLIEKPLRASRIGARNRWGAYRLGVATLAAVLLAVSAWQVVSVRKAAAYALSMDDPDHPGALARSEGFEYWGAENPALVPPLAALPDDWAGLDPDTCVLSPRNPDLEICTSGVPDPVRRIVLVGESHIGQWVAAIGPVAERRRWQVIVMARGGCPFSADLDGATRGPSCARWSTDATAEILALRPDAVFTLATHDVRAGLTERTPPGFVQRWRELERAGIPVLAVRDNPRFDYSPPECVMTHGADAAECSTPRTELLASEPPYRRVPDLPANVSFLDFSDYYCTEDACPPVVGNVLVYLDENHTSATFMATLAPIVDRLVPAALGW